MDIMVNSIDENFNYTKHEIVGEFIYIHVEPNSSEAQCPYCGQSSSKVHSKYIRKFQDLPVFGFKSIIVLYNKKYFCKNESCNKTTFTRKFECLQSKAKRTNRLNKEVINISKSMSSIQASKSLKDNIAQVCKSTICNLLKKETLMK